MSQQEYLNTLSDFMYHIGHAVGFDTEESKALLKRTEHALNTIEMLYLPREKHRNLKASSVFIRQMSGVEAMIAEKLYQHGDARHNFLKYDTDATGFIDAQEFRHLLELLEINLTDYELTYLIQKYDSSRNGKLNYSEFLKIGQNILRSETQTAYASFPNDQDEEDCENLLFDAPSVRACELAARIRTKLYQRFKSTTDLFLHLDSEKNSILSIDELAQGLENFGINVSNAELVDLTRSFTKTQDGMLSVKEFAKFLESPTALTFPSKIPMEDSEREIAVKDHETQTYRQSPTYQEYRNQLNQTKMPPAPPIIKDTNTLHKDLAQVLRDSGRQLKQLFSIFDPAGIGSISAANFFNGLRKLGILSSEQESTRLLAAFDETGSGTLEFHEFVKMIQSIYQEEK